MRIGSTLARIGAWLETARGDAELVVVDDGSTDDTCEIVQRFQRLVRVGCSFTLEFTAIHGKLGMPGNRQFNHRRPMFSRADRSVL